MVGMVAVLRILTASLAIAIIRATIRVITKVITRVTRVSMGAQIMGLRSILNITTAPPLPRVTELHHCNTRRPRTMVAIHRPRFLPSTSHPHMAVRQLSSIVHRPSTEPLLPPHHLSTSIMDSLRHHLLNLMAHHLLSLMAHHLLISLLISRVTEVVATIHQRMVVEALLPVDTVLLLLLRVAGTKTQVMAGMIMAQAAIVIRTGLRVGHTEASSPRLPITHLQDKIVPLSHLQGVTVNLLSS
mmetsp:Transcript_6857/g.13680  ORF Transcript_6857/g.13680 Transcript_6857/m.13680 type:complete len:243 (-) Transcript_6857:123-851(-)